MRNVKGTQCQNDSSFFHTVSTSFKHHKHTYLLTWIVLPAKLLAHDALEGHSLGDTGLNGLLFVFLDIVDMIVNGGGRAARKLGNGQLFEDRVVVAVLVEALRSTNGTSAAAALGSSSSTG